MIPDAEQANTGELLDNTPEDTLRLWEVLFGDQTGYLKTFTGEQARFSNPSARQNELTRVANRTWRYPEQAPPAAAYLIRQSNMRKDSYFGVHLYRSTGAGRLAADAVDLVRALWVDGDGAKVPAPWPLPSAVVHSSHGREHFYWTLEQPIPAREAVKLNKRMAVAMGADRGKAGLSTVLRAPDTLNYKRDTPELVTMEITGGRYTANEIDSVVPELPVVLPRVGPGRLATKRPPWAKHIKSREFDLVEWMGIWGVPAGSEVMDSKGRKWRLLECPIAPPGKEHSDGVYIGHHASGAPWFQCYHDHGQGYTWQDVRPIFQPGCYIPWWVGVVSKSA